MFVDSYISTPGSSYEGGVVNLFAGRRFDAGYKRPYLDKYDRPCVTVNTGRWTVEKGEKVPLRQKVLISSLPNHMFDPVWNATSLRKEDWIMLDTNILRSTRQRLRAWDDLMSMNPFGGFNGMAKMLLEHETMSDPGEAVVDMDGLASTRGDSPLFQLEGLPLPITHSDFWYSERRLAISRNSDTPLDSVSGEAAGRRIGERVEQTTIGTVDGISYGATGALTGGGAYSRTSAVRGYTNFSLRNTKTDLTVPTGSNPEATVQDVLEMRETMFLDGFFGPYMIYHSTSYDQFLDNDYARLGGDNASMTLRDRLRRIEGITDVRRLDYLTSGYQLLMVQMTPDVARAVNGLDLTTVQWPSKGGAQLNFKVMCIWVPQIRADYSGRCGIVHGTTS